MQDLLLVGLPGPTHFFGGLSEGNLASQKSALQESRPREAALQVLNLMYELYKKGVPVAVCPPHPRPYFKSQKEKDYFEHIVNKERCAGNDDFGMSNTKCEISDLKRKKGAFLGDKSKKEGLEIDFLLSRYSSSFMWTANMATVTPSRDSTDKNVHITPSNLKTFLHRSIETSFSTKILRMVFKSDCFCIHDPVEKPDEGAANHARLDNGIHLFSYNFTQDSSNKLVLRQSLSASKQVAKNHLLDFSNCMFFQQNVLSVQSGVFHNDVLFLSHKNVIFCHEQTFEKMGKVFDDVCRQWGQVGEEKLVFIRVDSKELTVEEAVHSYLFNSQLISNEMKNGMPSTMTLIASSTVKLCPRSRAVVDRVLKENESITHVIYVDLTESMKNGGGPACLRLRIPVTNEELELVHPGVIFDETLYYNLKDWINSYYREKLNESDFFDKVLAVESTRALSDLSKLLDMDDLYRGYEYFTEMNGVN